MTGNTLQQNYYELHQNLPENHTYQRTVRGEITKKSSAQKGPFSGRLVLQTPSLPLRHTSVPVSVTPPPPQTVTSYLNVPL